jgi:hypothetical protein
MPLLHKQKSHWILQYSMSPRRRGPLALRGTILKGVITNNDKWLVTVVNNHCSCSEEANQKRVRLFEFQMILAESVPSASSLSAAKPVVWWRDARLIYSRRSHVASQTTISKLRCADSILVLYSDYSRSILNLNASARRRSKLSLP